MDDKLKQNLAYSLSKGKRYLLGLSGGSDSLALFYALIEDGFEFEVCTIDHQSREEIVNEVAFIRKICCENRITFHLEQVEGIAPSGSNLEDKYRRARYALFEKVYSRGEFEGLILGHHADDQVETVLKRFLEGASVKALKGISQVTNIRSMKIVRPFLSLKKETIVQWLKERNKSWFEDPTNQDCNYLRARMRKKILPTLQRDFGKDFRENIIRFSHKMEQIEKFFHQKVQSPTEGVLGKFYPIDNKVSEIEAEFILREILKREGWSASREEVQRFSLAIANQENGIEICREGKRIISDFHGLFFPVKGEMSYSLSEGKCDEAGWRGVIKGKVSLGINCQGALAKEPGNLNNKLPSGMSLKKWYVKHKVPPHFRSCMPVIWKDGSVIGECLSGHPKVGKGVNWVLTFNVKKNTIEHAY